MKTLADSSQAILQWFIESLLSFKDYVIPQISERFEPV